jgi:hypothetical protein
MSAEWSELDEGAWRFFWRAWRFAADRSPASALRVYIAEVEPRVEAWDVTQEIQRKLTERRGRFRRPRCTGSVMNSFLTTKRHVPTPHCCGRKKNVAAPDIPWTVCQ